MFKERVSYHGWHGFVRQRRTAALADVGAQEIRILSRDEKSRMTCAGGTRATTQFYIGDVRDRTAFAVLCALWTSYFTRPRSSKCHRASFTHGGGENERHRN